ncbi:hypothetical protein LTR36_001751 [Oleoguttula mirabilis]|uniref:SGNH hydrolase-type esterase domain-containing protein n=1 Tax=Oleoguttula mirabilis TaxID=1507867 RepID=A0AAV9JNJ3_9PEZI|nr:hypothetical protein LTR36_001751 [Oleoguttula mirabilis]
MPLDQFVLFGDSITQQSFSQSPATGSFAFGAALADAYARKLDVVNRGLSGYCTVQAYRALPLCIPEPEAVRMRFLLVFFGANDARIAGSPGGPDQTVPLAEYKSNLRHIIEHPAVQVHEGVKIILVTTPPIDERKALRADQEKYPTLAMQRVLRRTAANTALYAQAARDLGEELGVPVLDIWSAMVARAGHSRHDPITPGSMEAPVNDTLQSYLHDGLHFTGEGYKVLYGELMALIERTWPEEMPARLRMKLPAWDNGKTWVKPKADDVSGEGTLRASGVFEAVVHDVQKLDRWE